METLMVDRVQSSLRLFMHRNAIFLCERLCAEFPSELNLQLLATCYLHNNQAYCAYHILKGTKLPQSRYLFAVSCFQMNLLRDAEAALCPANEPNTEVPNGAAGHYLLGLIYRFPTFMQFILFDSRYCCLCLELAHYLSTDNAVLFIKSVHQVTCISHLHLAAMSALITCTIGLLSQRYTGRRTAAVDQFIQALSADPLLWAAYEELCILGAAEEANECFNDAAALRIQQQHLSDSNLQKLNTSNDNRSLSSSMTVDLGDTSPRQSKQLHSNNKREVPSHPHGIALAAMQAANCMSSNVAQYDTPSPTATQTSGVAPPPVCRNPQMYLNSVGVDAPTRSNVNAAIQAPRRKYVDEAKLRKVSGRLFSDSGPRRSTRLSAEATASANFSISQIGSNGVNHSSAKLLGGYSSFSSSKMTSAALRSVIVRKGHQWSTESLEEGRRPEVFDVCRSDSLAAASSDTSNVADGRCFEQDTTGGILAHDSRLLSGIQNILGLLRTLGEGYRLSCLYRCQEALEAYLKLSEKQFNTGWVLSQVGKAHFELVDYFEADHFFELARRLSPYTLEGMDIYSTVLYHLKEEMKLSYLAQELISIDRLCPQAWCAVGNCYSLQKDHETALKNFQRAVHLDSRFAYAHTLCGHEYVALEDFESGIKCYQSALQVDERHYNSWYGLGVVYLRQEKFEFAEHHFRRAFYINPRSSVLLCYLGMALHSLRRNEDALKMMEQAISADKKNPLPMYQKAQILLSLEKYDEALEELNQLKEYVPRESSVYALMGRIYKQLNIHDKAMYYFGLALDLKPPAADVAAIKSAMEKLYLPDEMEDL